MPFQKKQKEEQSKKSEDDINLMSKLKKLGIEGFEVNPLKDSRHPLLTLIDVILLAILLAIIIIFRTTGMWCPLQ